MEERVKVEPLTGLRKFFESYDPPLARLQTLEKLAYEFVRKACGEPLDAPPPENGVTIQTMRVEYFRLAPPGGSVSEPEIIAACKACESYDQASRECATTERLQILRSQAYDFVRAACGEPLESPPNERCARIRTMRLEYFKLPPSKDKVKGKARGKAKDKVTEAEVLAACEAFRSYQEAALRCGDDEDLAVLALLVADGNAAAAQATGLKELIVKDHKWRQDASVRRTEGNKLEPPRRSVPKEEVRAMLTQIVGHDDPEQVEKKRRSKLTNLIREKLKNQGIFISNDTVKRAVGWRKT